ncbi:unnamed protein product, partial [marine sediment metagenome]
TINSLVGVIKSALCNMYLIIKCLNLDFLA